MGKKATKDMMFQPAFLHEATGVYYENLAWYLFEQEYNVFVLLPYKTNIT